MRSRWVPRLKTTLDRFFRRAAVDFAVMALVLVSVVLLLIEFYGGLAGEALSRVELAGDVITGIFIVELSLRWFAAPSTRAHWREFWLDWLAVVPVFRPMRVLRFLRFFRLFRLYRFGHLAHRFARTFEPRQFETALREATAHYTGARWEHVRLAPDLFRMLCNLLEDGRVHNEARAVACQALAYFVTPFDVLPEEVHGAEGYVDQVYLCLKAIDHLRGELPDHVLEGAWEGEGDAGSLATDTLPALERTLDAENREKALRYVGLVLESAAR